MLNELKKEANRTLTENSAATLRTTGSECLDLFATIGALRNAEEQEIIVRFARAYAEDRDLAMKMLFYSRDIRGGLGERRVFRTILKHLADAQPESVRKNLHLVSEYGRWDDLTVLFGTKCEKEAMAVIQEQLAKDLAALEAGENVSLMAKWLPSVNTSSADAVKDAKRIARALGMTEAQYRKTLVRLRAKIRIIENNLRQKDYTFEYSAQPSKAMLKYRKAFHRNDEERYSAFLERVSKGEETIHTATLYPYDIVEKAICFRGDETERKALDVTWNALEDYAPQGNALCVIDGSGSMYGWGTPNPITVALSLGMYFAEHCKGEFHNHFITFSRNPRLVEIKGKDLVEKVQYCETFNEVANTDIQKVFELILSTAVNHRLPQEELPETLYFISDMEFDCCADSAELTNFEYAKRLFEKHGYHLPKVVFWNVQSRNQQQPVSMNEQGVILVSGCTPRIFSMVANGKFDPVLLMKEVLLSERYAPVCA
ncbi:DUF2828 family protein [Clostridiales bacterium]|nr:DUF2828 family protein [Clostridiales bacterium]